jgi:hypothetical protein
MPCYQEQRNTCMLHSYATGVLEATPRNFKILGLIAFICEEIEYGIPSPASSHICIPGHIINLRNERWNRCQENPSSLWR